MLLQELAETSQRVAETRARLQKIELLAAALQRMRPDEIPVGIAYLSGDIPQGKLGIGFAMLRAALPATAAPQATLQLWEVDAILDRLSRIRGPGSTRDRRNLLNDLLRRATRTEQEFLVRLLLGELRQGALEGIMLEAIARAAGVPGDEVRRAWMWSGDLGAVARAALERGVDGLRGFRIRLFRPVLPMLAQTAETFDDVFARYQPAVLEYKLDGARVQIHRDGEEVRVYTRHLKDVTRYVPDLVAWARQLPVRQFILDGEALVLHPNGRPMPFQVTMRRFGTRLHVAELQQQLPLVPFIFDCLLLDGEDLTPRATTERSRALCDWIPPEHRVPQRVTADPEEARAFLTEARSRGHEGIMAKAPGAPYEAGRRGAYWLKIKPAQTLDLVVLAAEWGSGRRQGWLSNIHLGARDPRSGGFVMLGKTFKGMTDAMLRWQTQKFLELEIARDVHTVYLRPELVVEVAFDDIQRSPHYPGGLALRFARVKRYRPDKTPVQADTIDTVRAIYRRLHPDAETDTDPGDG